MKPPVARLPHRSTHERAAILGAALALLASASAGEQNGAGLEWTRQRALRGVQRVFAHPLDPTVAWCATTKGLVATHDDGHTWTSVESAEALGEVTCLAVSTRDPGVICLGTDARGLLLCSDDGESWKPLGGGAEGCASSHIEWVEFCPSDPTRRTLLATHGVVAPGLSVSRDLGATWEVLGEDRYLKRFVKQAETIVAVGSMTATEGKVWGIHRSGTDGQRWEETIRHIRPAAPAVTHSRWEFFVSTLDGAILGSSNDGRSWSALARSEGSAWTSLFFTNGPTGQSEVLAAYDPRRRGLCLSARRFADGLGEAQNRGLYVGPYVKSGATCAANANGTVYYVAMNNALWIGRWAVPARGPAVVQARCVPCSVRVDEAAIGRARDALQGHIGAIAADEPPEPHLRPIATKARAIADAVNAMRTTIQARVQHPGGPGAVRTVAVDAAGLGGSPATLLHDDGKHDDEKAGDGIYGATVRFTPTLFRQDGFRDALLLTVTAIDTAGARASWPARLHISRGPTMIGLTRGGWDSPRAEGPVTIRMVRDDSLRPHADVLRIAATGPGPWRATWIVPGDGANSAGLKWLTFDIKGDVSQELLVHLMDFHRIGSEGFFDEPHASAPAPLLAGGYLQSVTPAYQQVRIPLARLLPKGLYFLRWHTAGIALAVPEGGRPGIYHIHRARLEP